MFWLPTDFTRPEQVERLRLTQRRYGLRQPMAGSD